VYGDIGTNPLFAMREAFTARHHVVITEPNVFGLLSLMFWSLIIVITLKYVTFVMRADNDGEGGIVALSTLATGPGTVTHGRRRWYLLIGLFGAALLYGDGIITPAISVLAAVEGTTIAAPALHVIVIPAAIGVLIALFAIQHQGTGAIGTLFGPIMIVWFITMGVLGVSQIAQMPTVMRGLSPTYAVSFFANNGFTGFLVLGAVILVVVGGEALYADLGHFGRRPITIGWYALVLPSLVLVYFGQGALLLRDPAAVDNPFYRMAPTWALVPLVIIATVATVIASQALISGAFSLTYQSIQLGYSPRVRVRHTSEHHIGQIYLPAINWLLMIACIGLVLGFRHSANLAAAYGVAVTTTMVMTTILFYVVARDHFGWRPALVVPICALFLTVDLAFFVATLFKIPEGGWFPLAVAVLVFTVLTTWHTGRLLVRARLEGEGLALRSFVRDISPSTCVRAPGASAYLFATPGVTPPALLATYRHNDALHEVELIVSVMTEKRPRIPAGDRAEIVPLGKGFWQVGLHFGFAEVHDVPAALADHVVSQVPLDLAELSYFVGRESVRVTPRPGMARWREHLFSVLSRNASSTADLFQLPLAQTVEIGLGVEL
jgi:KUP system potassium uptake protein